MLTVSSTLNVSPLSSGTGKRNIGLDIGALFAKLALNTRWEQI
jgi:hypothetical protein